MKQFYAIMIFLSSILFLVSCEDKDMDVVERHNIGQMFYSPDFLWTEENVQYIKKTLELDFNQDARNWNSKATIELCDTASKPLDMSLFHIEVDNQELSVPEFDVRANQSSIELTIGCTPSAEAGSKQIFLKVKQGHSLDFINDKDVQNSDEALLMRMDFDYVVEMNPLAKGMMLSSISLLALVLLWLIVLRPILFPRFKNVTKTVIIPNQQPITMRMKGAREIVISNTRVKVSVLSRIFKGEIKRYVCPAIVSPIVFKPKNKKSILVKTNPSYYQVRPSNIIPTIGGQTEIKNVQDNTIIKIK